MEYKIWIPDDLVPDIQKYVDFINEWGKQNECLVIIWTIEKAISVFTHRFIDDWKERRIRVTIIFETSRELETEIYEYMAKMDEINDTMPDDLRYIEPISEEIAILSLISEGPYTAPVIHPA